MRIVPVIAVVALAGCATSHPIAPQVAAPSVDFADAAVQQVELSNFEFSPEALHLQAGRPYALRLVNAASNGHSFAAPEFFAAARIDAADAARVADGEVDLEGGETAIIHLVPAAGSYDLVCTHFGHAALGMKGRIDVE